MSTNLPPTTSSSFYLLSPDGDDYLSNQWPFLVSAVKGLRPYFESREIDGSDWDAQLRGIRYGQERNRYQWRTLVDADHFYFQKNSGTEASPNWVTQLQLGSTGPLLNLRFAEFDSLKVNDIVTAEAFYVRPNGSELSTVGLTVPDGSESIPSISFAGDRDTGLYRTTTTINFTVDAAQKLVIGGGSIQPQVAIRAPSGSAAQASYAFQSPDINLGMYRIATDTLGFTAGGVLKLSIAPTVSTFSTHVRMQDTLNVNNAVTAESFYLKTGGEVTDYPLDYFTNNNLSYCAEADRAQRFLRNTEELDIAHYTNKWQQLGHLPALPGKRKSERRLWGVDDYVSGLIETVEVQAIHIHKLNERVEMLEELLKENELDE